MRDVKGFCKLFDINIPNVEHFEYYIDIFSRLEKFKNIRDMIKLYEQAESKYDDIFKLKIDKSNEILDFLKSSRSYNDLNDDNLIPDLPTTKTFEYSESKKYISIDMRMANWVALKKYDPPFVNELGDSYAEFLNKFDVPEIFIHSKQFRQYIFGNISPRKQIKVQRLLMQGIVDTYKHLGLEVACIKNDEVIYSFEILDDVSKIIETVDQNMFKIKLFTVERIKDFRINTFMNHDGDFLYKELAGCNGNLLFLLLKQYIFNEPLDIRDLYFVMDGNLAIWNVDGLKLELK